MAFAMSVFQTVKKGFLFDKGGCRPVKGFPPLMPGCAGTAARAAASPGRA